MHDLFLFDKVHEKIKIAVLKFIWSSYYKSSKYLDVDCVYLYIYFSLGFRKNNIDNALQKQILISLKHLISLKKTYF